MIGVKIIIAKIDEAKSSCINTRSLNSSTAAIKMKMAKGKVSSKGALELTHPLFCDLVALDERTRHVP